MKPSNNMKTTTTTALRKQFHNLQTLHNRALRDIWKVSELHDASIDEIFICLIF